MNKSSVINNMPIYVNARFLTQKVTGVQRFAIEICKILKKLDSNIKIVSPSGVLDHQLAKELEAITIGTHCGTFWEQIDLPKYLKTVKNPLLINLCNTAPVFYNNKVVTIHDMSYKINPKWFSKKFYMWYNYLIPAIAKRSKRVITVSESSKQDIVNHLPIPAEKISVIYNASSIQNVPATTQQTAGRKHLLTISSLDPRKNLNTLLKAFNRLNKDIDLIIVGLKSKNFSAAIDPSLLTEKIIIKGYVSDADLTGLLAGAEAFVYLSLYEGFGLPPIEAMSIGCPVIVSDIPAHREVCADAALYVYPNNTAAITAQIEKLLSDSGLRNTLIEKGLRNAQRFSWDSSAQKLLKIIHELN